MLRELLQFGYPQVLEVIPLIGTTYQEHPDIASNLVPLLIQVLGLLSIQEVT